MYDVPLLSCVRIIVMLHTVPLVGILEMVSVVIEAPCAKANTFPADTSSVVVDVAESDTSVSV